MVEFDRFPVGGNGHLQIGGCDSVELAREFGTPLYVLDEARVRTACRQYREEFQHRYADTEVSYAGKALLCQALCALVESEGLGLDVASEGELHTALGASFAPGRITAHGNYKREAYLRRCLEAGVGHIVVDSLPELTALSALADDMGCEAAILIRVAPGIKTQTHTFIQTGQEDSKFGLGIASGDALAAVRRAAELPGLRLRGIHCHIGSQLFGLDSFRRTVEVMTEFLAEARAACPTAAEVLNLGGGLGIRYTHEDAPPTVAELAAAIAKSLVACLDQHGLGRPTLMLEPGRSIVGPAGVTLYTIGVVKEIPGVRTYVSVDGGLSDNPRPCMYGAEYEATIANKAGRPRQIPVRVSGSHCETDTLIRDVPVQAPEQGDVLAVFATGAYNYAMASNYNRFPRPAMVLVHDGEAEVIVARETMEDLVRQDRIPARLQRGHVPA